MNKLTVLDAIMGSGKTEYVLSMLRQAHAADLQSMFLDEGYASRKFLVVVPYLEEAKRYQAGCVDLRLRQPAQVEGAKLKGLVELIRRGENIVTTHSLFLSMTDHIAKLILDIGYELIVDETPQVINLYDDLTAYDMNMLTETKLISISSTTGKLLWNKDTKYNGRFDDVRELSTQGYLVKEGKTVVSVYPSKFFRCFTKVTVCTYLFRGSVFDAYCRSEGLDVELMTFDGEGTLVPFDDGTSEIEVRHKLQGKLSIYKGRMNDVGAGDGKTNPLSSGWFGRAKDEELKSLRSSTSNFFDRIAETPSKLSGWTTYKAYKSSLSGKGYARGFISANARATNDFADKAAMAFLCNWFEHPSIVRYFKAKGVEVDEDQIALSILLQWIWRSRIRKGESIHLFVPSQRMRGLLDKWLEAGPKVKVDAGPTTEAILEAA